MADPARARKVADRIKVVVAEYLEYRIKDERLGFITITDVRVTGDLQNATVFYTAFGTALEQQDTARALETARGRIRSAVGQQLGIRLTPTLAFMQDALPEGAAHLEDVLAATIAADLELAKAREGKVHAGEADPYKKPVVDGDDEAETEAVSGGEPAGDDGR
ncbi:30S ribosome-binding factor RbfA [Dermatophilaceae bacterium Soc4.6]